MLRVGKFCLFCFKAFMADARLVKKGYGKYCSRECYHLSTKGKIPWNKGLKGTQIANSGTFKKGVWKFKGTLQEYKAIHYWVQTQLGKPNKCEGCGEVFEGKKIHWANKSGMYLKKISDWIRLCARCHFEYDKGRNGIYA